MDKHRTNCAFSLAVERDRVLASRLTGSLSTLQEMRTDSASVPSSWLRSLLRCALDMKAQELAVHRIAVLEEELCSNDDRRKS